MPLAAFTTGHLKLPRFTSFEQMLAERKKYLWYEAMYANGFILTGYRYNDLTTIQIYTLPEGEIAYSYSWSKEDTPGIPMTHNGKTMHIIPSGYPTDGGIFMLAMPDDEDGDEQNPAILRIRLKNRK